MFGPKILGLGWIWLWAWHIVKVFSPCLMFLKLDEVQPGLDGRILVSKLLGSQVGMIRMSPNVCEIVLRIKMNIDRICNIPRIKVHGWPRSRVNCIHKRDWIQSPKFSRSGWTIRALLIRASALKRFYEHHCRSLLNMFHWFLQIRCHLGFLIVWSMFTFRNLIVASLIHVHSIVFFLDLPYIRKDSSVIIPLVNVCL